MTSRKVLICQNTACRQKKAAQVLAAFWAKPIAEVEIVASGCLGQCGNGPMVLILPDQVWYCQVLVDEVAAIVERHLLQNQPVRSMLYPKFHGKTPYV